MSTSVKEVKPLTASDFIVEDFSKGKRDFPLPFVRKEVISDEDRVLYQSAFRNPSDLKPDFSFEIAGQRSGLYYDPKQTIVGIVTCGGLAAGLNDVIRAVSHTCFKYGVKKVYGFKYGWLGLSLKHREYIEITPEILTDVHLVGGSFLASSRANVPSVEVAKTCVDLGVNVMFCVGGDGTQKGGQELYEECEKLGYKISVVGIPKTMDNDVLFVSRTFGFETAFHQASEFIKGAHVESKGVNGGVCLIRLFGRDSGFIAAHAALASGYANIVLIPEEPFTLRSLYEAIRRRVVSGRDCLIVVAEGAGVDILKALKDVKIEQRGLGNINYGDIGVYLKNSIAEHFKKNKLDIVVRYIDPTYCIRNTPPTANDAAFCEELGNKAVDSALAGKTRCIVGYWNERFTLVPYKMIGRGRKTIDLNGSTWSTVKAMTIDLQAIEKELAEKDVKK